MKDFRNFINGEWVSSARTFENRNPVDNRLIGHVHEAGRAEVDAAVRAARAALAGPWGTMTVAARVDLLHAVADGIHRRFDDFLAAEIADTGKPHSLASHLDIPRGAANFKVQRSHAETAAQVAELFDRREALARDRRQRFLGRNQQIGVGRSVRAANAAAQLIKLRQPVSVGEYSFRVVRK